MWGRGLNQSLEGFAMGLHEQRSIALINRRYLVARYKSFDFRYLQWMAIQKRVLLLITDHWTSIPPPIDKELT